MWKFMGKVEYVKKLFWDFFEVLLEGEVVFIIFDLFFWLGGEFGDNDKGDDFVEELVVLRVIL